MEGHQKFLGGGGSYRPKFYKQNCLEFSGGKWVQNKNLLWGECTLLFHADYKEIRDRINSGRKLLSINVLVKKSGLDELIKEKLFDLSGIQTHDSCILVTDALPTELQGQIGAGQW